MTTIAEFLAAANVQIAPVEPGAAGAPAVTIELPEEWQAVDRSVFPGAYGVWTLPPAGGWADNVVLLVGRFSKPADAQELLACAFTDARALPKWREIVADIAEFEGYPSADVVGTYSLETLDLWVHTRYVVVVAGTEEYLVQITVTAKADHENVDSDLLNNLVIRA
ncbi:LpqN/LpqT family lipoprotein [Nocardia huaxiensis]|uniref:LpqN/LpqT family lipoprotein n=1 Tax=Nocardia huaxiensis TaxID=2755382 RepID=A0A7D6ZJI5_9NOCA|nr:LpqN/LpqT family lipoprotein [Nocardia huaxiensis]QLY32559.1 LpqN/LpqT family lipoprotein [Nocardia huaxiensis]UFS93713.1 LpqN/LpqT family lipoprotein [Nocardia huaxiensis]